MLHLFRCLYLTAETIPPSLRCLEILRSALAIAPEVEGSDSTCGPRHQSLAAKGRRLEQALPLFAQWTRTTHALLEPSAEAGDTAHRKKVVTVGHLKQLISLSHFF